MFGPVEPKQTANELITPLRGESAIVSEIVARFRGEITERELLCDSL